MTVGIKYARCIKHVRCGNRIVIRAGTIRKVLFGGDVDMMVRSGYWERMIPPTNELT